MAGGWGVGGRQDAVTLRAPPPLYPETKLNWSHFLTHGPLDSSGLNSSGWLRLLQTPRPPATIERGKKERFLKIYLIYMYG